MALLALVKVSVTLGSKMITERNITRKIPAMDTIISFIERSPEIIEKIKALIPQKKKDSEEAETDAPAPESVVETAVETAAEVAE